MEARVFARAADRCAALHPPDAIAGPAARRARLFAAVLFVAGAVAALPVGARAAEPAQPRVVLVSIDGLRADAVTAATAPTLAALAARGAVGTALADLPPVTMTNHASMLTGLSASTHRVYLDTDLPGTIAFPTLFDYARAAGLRCAFLASKDKLRYFAPPDAVETLVLASDTAGLIDTVLPLLAPDGPDLVFIHLRDPDSAGHADEWMSPAYLAAVARVDDHVARLAAALAGDLLPRSEAPRAAVPAPDTPGAGPRPSYLLITADHGGEGRTHVLDNAATRRVPWIVVGPDIAAGDALPGTVRPADTTATALWLLGVALPEGLDGRAQTLVKGRFDFGPPSAPGSPSAAPRPALAPPCFLVAVPLLAALAGCRRRRA